MHLQDLRVLYALMNELWASLKIIIHSLLKLWGVPEQLKYLKYAHFSSLHSDFGKKVNTKARSHPTGLPKIGKGHEPLFQARLPVIVIKEGSILVERWIENVMLSSRLIS